MNTPTAAHARLAKNNQPGKTGDRSTIKPSHPKKLVIAPLLLNTRTKTKSFMSFPDGLGLSKGTQRHYRLLAFTHCGIAGVSEELIHICLREDILLISREGQRESGAVCNGSVDDRRQSIDDILLSHCDWELSDGAQAFREH